MEKVCFYKFWFEINQFVLRPRSDSELLVEHVVKNFYNKKITILELGVGSGCLLLSILRDLPLARGMGIDISSRALHVFEQNIKSLQLGDRVKVLQNNWLDHHTQPFDLLVTNPPYVTNQEIIAYQLTQDPTLALIENKKLYTQIKEKESLFKYFIIEINPSYVNWMLQLFPKAVIIKDYVNLPRFITNII